MDYFDNSMVTYQQLNKLFFNQETAYSTNFTMGCSTILLRSASSYDGCGAEARQIYVIYVDGTSGRLNYAQYSIIGGARPAFVIDLSKIDFEITDTIV